MGLAEELVCWAWEGVGGYVRVGWTCLLPVFWGLMPLRITAVGISGAAEGPYQAQLSRGRGQVEQNPVHHQSVKLRQNGEGLPGHPSCAPPPPHQHLI